jgi:outer membrane immunogenic protein
MKRISTLLAAASLLALSQAAYAADMSRPVYKAAPPPAPVWTWQGLYIGGHLGGGWASDDVTATGFGTGSLDSSGFIGGGQIGYNFQLNPNWVVGVEGDISWSGVDGSRNVGAFAATSDHNWYATLAGRLGYTTGPWMIYGKGGGAWADVDYAGTVAGVSSTWGDTRSGWMVGVGLEWMFAPQWSAKVEYNYLDFGGTTRTLPALGTVVTTDSQVNLIKVGINYKLF